MRLIPYTLVELRIAGLVAYTSLKGFFAGALADVGDRKSRPGGLEFLKASK